MMTHAGSLPARQRGAALIIGLVLLMVLTVLGISGMSTSLLEASMANNMQQAQFAFQAAESAIDNQIVAGGPFTMDDTTLPGTVMSNVVYEYRINPDDEAPVATANASTVHRTIAAMVPGGGWELGTLSAVHFQVDVTATSEARGAASRQRAGYYIVAPSP